MDKMFTRTLLGAAIALAAASGSANAAIDLLDGNVQLYGQAAGGLIIANPEGEDTNVTADIESRIGFRGTVDFDNLAPNFIWQIESGNANATPTDKPNGQGVFGFRDTYVGLDFEGVGSIKYGRQLTAAYNYVDWPHSNPGIGGVFDRSWAPDVGGSFQDRADHVIRFDSANFGGFNFQGTLSGMEKTTDDMAVSVAASYTADAFTVHGGYYTRDLNTATINSNSYFILGGAAYLGDITLTAAAKYMEADHVADADADQWAYSATAQYVADGTWLYKLGLAYAAELEQGGSVSDTEDLAVTGRVGYLLPSAILYTDVRYADFNGSSEAGDGTNIHLGVEYYF
ncbi:porin [Photobacterium nomapromontoriensis]|uniref:porin n=1 Tax=Photobacterium nomapromontoriensis TaxID=2910237 RepID=UPI003D0BD673